MKSLLAANILFLQQGIDLLENITDSHYTFDSSDYFQSSTGKHMRHILDHYQSLVSGWHDKVDYDARIRKTDIESKRKAAIDKCRSLMQQLAELEKNPVWADRKILVKSNEDTGDTQSVWSNSSIKRELQFLISHTVHHYSLIAFILRVQGVEVPKHFGVAPSTISYEQTASSKR